jgi:hypothetical protein
MSDDFLFFIKTLNIKDLETITIFSIIPKLSRMFDTTIEDLAIKEIIAINWIDILESDIDIININTLFLSYFKYCCKTSNKIYNFTPSNIFDVYFEYLMNNTDLFIESKTNRFFYNLKKLNIQIQDILILFNNKLKHSACYAIIGIIIDNLNTYNSVNLKLYCNWDIIVADNTLLLNSENCTINDGSQIIKYYSSYLRKKYPHIYDTNMIRDYPFINIKDFIIALISSYNKKINHNTLFIIPKNFRYNTNFIQNRNKYNFSKLFKYQSQINYYGYYLTNNNIFISLINRDNCHELYSYYIKFISECEINNDFKTLTYNNMYASITSTLAKFKAYEVNLTDINELFSTNNLIGCLSNSRSYNITTKNRLSNVYFIRGLFIDILTSKFRYNLHFDNFTQIKASSITFLEKTLKNKTHKDLYQNLVNISIKYYSSYLRKQYSNIDDEIYFDYPFTSWSNYFQTYISCTSNNPIYNVFFHNISVNGCYNPINDIEELLNEELNVEEGVKLFNDYSNDMKLINDEVPKINDLFKKYINYI